MNILVVADVESKYLWDYFDSSQKEKVDLIISCGDLDADYLSFLTTMYNCDVLYVHGNHDEGYETKPPEGCTVTDAPLTVRVSLGFEEPIKKVDGEFIVTFCLCGYTTSNAKTGLHINNTNNR